MQFGQGDSLGIVWDFEHVIDPVIYRRSLPISITPLLGELPCRLADPQPADDVFQQTLAPHTLYPEALCLPQFLIAAESSLPVPGQTGLFIPPPATRALPFQPDPVERMVFAVGNVCAVAIPVTSVAPQVAALAPRPFLVRAGRSTAIQISAAPVEGRITSSMAHEVALPAAQIRLPEFQIAGVEPYLAPVPVPPVHKHWTANPQADSLSAASDTATADPAAITWLPKLDVEPVEPVLEPAQVARLRSRWMPAPAAEPVSSMPAPEAAEAAKVQPWLPKFEVEPFEPAMPSARAPQTRERWTPSAGQTSPLANPSAGPSTPAPSSPKLPVFQVRPVEASLEPMPVPQACDEWMPSLQAEAVCVEVLAISVPERCVAPAGKLPDLRRFSVADPWMPQVERLKPAPTAEPVSMRVWPKTAMVALPTYDELPAPVLPDARELRAGDTSSPSAAIAPAAFGLAAEPVECFVLPISQPAPVENAAPHVLQLPVFSHEQAPAAAQLAPAAQGLEAEPVETMPSCAAFYPLPLAAAPQVELPGLPQTASRNPAVAPENSVIVPGVRPFRPAAAAQAVTIEPVRTLFVVPPQPYQSEPAAAEVAVRGFVALEFYCQQATGSPSSRMAWCAPVNQPLLPALSLHPVVERTEEASPSKSTQDHPAFTAIFRLPEVARKQAGSALVRHGIRAIAACLLLGSILWFGVGALQIGSQTPAVNRDISFGDMASNTPSRSLSPSGGIPAPGGTRAPAAPGGAMAKIRSVIANRAAVTMTDSFRNGMQAWGTASKQFAAGWSRHPDGYVSTGQLALFRPSINYKDYHLEFFGQIENKSMGWAIRAHDTDNYYAMKLKVIEPGLRPVVAMVHYPVVNGKRGRPIEIPLNIMVHNNQPMQVEVDVRGDKLLTSVDGQLVDTWIDETLVAGGVGFFSEAGERARLYWMRISKNEDFLGRICAYVANTLGDGTRASAELWPNQIPTTPQPQPVPERPAEAALAATAAELQNRITKYSRRERWNS